MNLQSLCGWFDEAEDSASLDAILKSNWREIVPLFYGLESSQFPLHRAEYSRVLIRLANSNAGRQLRRLDVAPNAVRALMMLFASRFETAGWYLELRRCRDLLPAGDRLVAVVEAVFTYRYINDAAGDYLIRCPKVLEHLGSISEGDFPGCPSLAADLVREFIMEASAQYLAAHADARSRFRARLYDWGLRPPLAALGWEEIEDLLNQSVECLPPRREKVRSAIVEGMFREAERLGDGHSCGEVEDATILVCAEEPPRWNRLPDFVDDELEAMGAKFDPSGAEAGDNVGNDETRNRAYLGTYFPRTVIEARNIVGEILSLPIIRSHLERKGHIRVLDIGAGTGGATVGTALALRDAGCRSPLNVVAIDGNPDALGKMKRLVLTVARELQIDVGIEQRLVQLQPDLDGFAGTIRECIATVGDPFDIVLCWKFLSEFYDRGWARASGIIGATLAAMASRVDEGGFCVVADITTRNRRPEYFSKTLNRESREYERREDAWMRTVIPVPCAKFRDQCSHGNCFTLRKMSIGHRLVQDDTTKLAYRVFVPMALESRVVRSFSSGDVYNVDSNNPTTGCASGCVQHAPSPRSGWTGF
jgi:SAM-dependent methyltransferase